MHSGGELWPDGYSLRKQTSLVAMSVYSGSSNRSHLAHCPLVSNGAELIFSFLLTCTCLFHGVKSPVGGCPSLYTHRPQRCDTRVGQRGHRLGLARSPFISSPANVAYVAPSSLGSAHLPSQILLLAVHDEDCDRRVSLSMIEIRKEKTVLTECQ